MLQILDLTMGLPRPSLNVQIDYFSHSCQKMCKTDIKRTLDVTFLDCLALTFCDIIGDLLPQWARLALLDGTTFRLMSYLLDIPVSRVRISLSICVKLLCFQESLIKQNLDVHCQVGMV